MKKNENSVLYRVDLIEVQENADYGQYEKSLRKILWTYAISEKEAKDNARGQLRKNKIKMQNYEIGSTWVHDIFEARIATKEEIEKIGKKKDSQS